MNGELKPIELAEKKSEIKKKIGNKGNRRLLSAQEYAQMTTDEKDILNDILAEDGDFIEFEKNMKALWPKKFTPKPLVWRKK